MDLATRFNEKVDKAGDCWVWTAGLDRKGYGRFRLPTCHISASRQAYILAYGPIADGLHVCHHCDNPACVRPDHLFLGTHQDNMRDMREKHRGFIPHHHGDEHWTRRHPDLVLKGERHPAARLNAVQVAEIRRLWGEGAMSYSALAKEYETGKTQIGRIVRGESWSFGGKPSKGTPKDKRIKGNKGK